MQLKKVLKLLVICILFDLMAFLAMVAVYTIPTSKINLNLSYSLNIYRKERSYPQYIPAYHFSLLNNQTDALMLNKAMHDGGNDLHSIVQSAMLNPEYNVPNISGDINILMSAVSQGTRETIINDPRYWHGYLVFLKPLLYCFTVPDIRAINIILQFVLFAYLLLLLYKQGGYKLALPFLIFPIVLNPFSCAFCLQYAIIYYTTLIANLLMLKRKLYTSDRYWELFLIIGLCVAFLDSLSYPLVSLGIPLILLTVLSDEELFPKIKKVIFASIAWSIGYTFSWLSNWSLTTMITGHNIFSEAWHSVKWRTLYSDLSDNTIETALKRNLDVLFLNHNLPHLFIVICLILIFICVYKRYSVKIKSSTILPLLLITVYPFVWIIIVRNHSILHYWMTYRIFAISFLAFAYIISYSLEKKTKKRYKNKVKTLMKIVNQFKFKEKL